MKADRLRAQAQELRAAFDRSFAVAPPPPPPPHLDLLAIRCERHALALRLTQVSALYADRKPVPFPGPRPELLGLVAARGVVTPAYDLHALLGYERVEAPRWLAFVRAPAPFAVAFASFERHLRVPASALLSRPPQAEARHSAPESVLEGDSPRSVIDLLALFEKVVRGPRRQFAPEREDP